MSDDTLDDLLDRLVSEYSDRVAGGETPSHAELLARVAPSARPGLERCLKMIDAGLAQIPSAATPLVPGSRLGRYELRRELGRGGMARVWLARDEELDRAVALKVLRPGLAAEELHVERFRREALAMAKLRHPNVVQVFDVGEERGHHFLAMEFVEGPSLASVLEALPADRRWTSDELARATGGAVSAVAGRTFEEAAAMLLAPVADALHAAHERGLVHRDVKPSNILLRRDGTPVVADFGLAKSSGDPALSLTGEPLGTPYYMSPEQARLSEVRVDHRTDVYSLGVTLYELLTGRRPYDGATVLEVFDAIKTTVPAGVRSLEPRCSRDAAAVVRRAMRSEPEQRYTDAAALRDELTRLAESGVTHARRDEGGPLRRAWTQARLLTSGQPLEYRSERRFLGLPLLHVYAGPRYPGQPTRVARGWFAVGDVALGGIAFGRISAGGFAAGALSAGVLGSFGGMTAALGFAVGGLALGTFTWGGVAAGYLAFGGVALGYGAIGGWVRGVYAMGGNADGRYVISDARQDLTEEEWLRGVLPWLSRFLGDGGG